jgi:hypothetical protein
VGLVGLVLAIALYLLKLIDSRLELLLCIFEVLLRLLLLALKKFKFTFPKRTVLIIVVDLVLQLD